MYRPGGCPAAALIACVDDCWLAVARAPALQLEQRGRVDKVAELRIAVGAGVKVRALVGDDVAHGCQRGAAIVVGSRLDSVTEQVEQGSVPLELCRVSPRGRFDGLAGGGGGLSSYARFSM